MPARLAKSLPVATPTRRMSAEERREQLLDVLADIITSEGYAAISIDRVARDANIARTVIYSHFGNLEGFVAALVERTEREALRQIRGVLPDIVDDDPDVILTEAIRAFLTVVRDDPRLWRLAVLPVDGAPADLRDRIRRAKQAVLALLQPIVTWGLEQRGGPKIDPELFARLIITAAEDTARLVLAEPETYTPERFADFVATLMASVARD
jgi:AcrR family transcriptional regulator